MPSTVRTRLWGGNRTGPRPHPNDPDILAIFQEQLAKGTPVNHAAVLAGIHENTAYRWIAEGDSILTADDGSTPLGELGSQAEFGWTIKVAQARFVSETLDDWHAADGKLFAKYATLLERRAPENFGR